MLRRFFIGSIIAASTTTTAVAQWWQDGIALPRADLGATTIGDLALFGGGWNESGVYATVDVYDASQDDWSTASLSMARRWLAAGTAGDKAIFAGGRSSTFGPVDVVDVFDATQGTWTTAQLSAPRTHLAGASWGDTALFAGGYAGFFVASDVVDVYDDATGTWSTTALSQPRWGIAATAAAGKIFFAGGVEGFVASDVVDVYDVATGTWTVEHLSLARAGVSAAAVGNLVLFAGGGGPNYTNSDVVDIFDVTTGLWSTATLSLGRASILTAEVDGLAIFAGGMVDVSLEVSLGVAAVDIFDPATNTWSVDVLSDPRGAGAATTVGGRAIFAGGIQATIPCYYMSDRVDSYRPLIGTGYCGPAVTNSTGLPARIEAYGSVDTVANDLDLTALDLPLQQFGYFLASETAGFVPNPGGSQGNLCLGGTLGRFVTQVQSSGTNGRFSIPVDLTAMPTPLQQVVQPGETWYFQAWFRDTNPTPTSNFTDGMSVSFL